MKASNEIRQLCNAVFLTTPAEPPILSPTMTTLTFDTLQLTNALKQAGIPAEQAEAVVG